MSWKANKTYFCINNPLKPQLKKLKMPWGSTQAYQHSLHIFSY